MTMTVLGEISSRELGFIQCHEHIMLSKGVSYECHPALWFDDIEKSTSEVNAYKAAGGRTLIDAQPGGCNRMAEELGKISAASGVHIIASTGFHKLCFYTKDHFIRNLSEKELLDFFVSELTKGMYTNIDSVYHKHQCSYKAGIIKTALDCDNLTPAYKRLFTAAAKAALTTNRTMMIHVEKGSDPMALLTYLRSLGLPPERMMFCHMDRACPDRNTHYAIAESGAYLEYDTIGRFQYHDDEAEIQIFRDMTEKGYEDRLLFSLDTTGARLKAYTPEGIGLTYLFTDFIPLLASVLSKEQMHKISVTNASTLLA